MKQLARLRLRYRFVTLVSRISGTSDGLVYGLLNYHRSENAQRNDRPYLSGTGDEEAEIERSHDLVSNDACPPIFNVSASTVPIALAEAIAKVLRRQDALALQAMGAAAVYRAIQALCIARVLLVDEQIDLHFSPSFGETEVAGKVIVGIILEVEYRSPIDVPPIRLDRR